MKIIIPIDENKGLDSKLASHFGRCQKFLLLDENGVVSTALENLSTHTGGTKQPPEIVRESGAEVLICKGLGMKAITMLTGFKVEIYLTGEDTVKASLALFKQNKLAEACEKNCCKEGKH